MTTPSTAPDTVIARVAARVARGGAALTMLVDVAELLVGLTGARSAQVFSSSLVDQESRALGWWPPEASCSSHFPRFLPGDWLDRLRRVQVVILTRASPGVDSLERGFLERRGSQRLLVLPVLLDDTLQGGIVLDDPGSERPLLDAWAVCARLLGPALAVAVHGEPAPRPVTGIEPMRVRAFLHALNNHLGVVLNGAEFTLEELDPGVRPQPDLRLIREAMDDVLAVLLEARNLSDELAMRARAIDADAVAPQSSSQTP